MTGQRRLLPAPTWWRIQCDNGDRYVVAAIWNPSNGYIEFLGDEGNVAIRLEQGTFAVIGDAMTTDAEIEAWIQENPKL